MQNAKPYLDSEHTCGRGAVDTRFAYTLLGYTEEDAVTYADEEVDTEFFKTLEQQVQESKLELLRTVTVCDAWDSVLDLTVLHLYHHKHNHGSLVVGSTKGGAPRWAVFPTPKLYWERVVEEQRTPTMYLCEPTLGTRVYAVVRYDVVLEHSYRFTLYSLDNNETPVGNYPDPQAAKDAAEQGLRR